MHRRIPCLPTSAERHAPLCSAGRRPSAAMCKPVPMATEHASGTTRVATGPARNAPISKPSAGSPASRRGCWPVIFTLPHELNPLWLANVPVMTTLLFQAVRDTLGTLLADPKYLGAQPGILAALHTWSQTLVLHPHLHCLITGGGLTPAGQWVAVRHGFLLPARVVVAVFRGKMVDAIRRTLARGELVLPEPMGPQQVLNLLNRLGHPTKTKWNVRIMERYRHGAGVVTYLARYLRGGPLTNGRLVAY